MRSTTFLSLLVIAVASPIDSNADCDPVLRTMVMRRFTQSYSVIDAPLSVMKDDYSKDLVTYQKMDEPKASSASTGDLCRLTGMVVATKGQIIMSLDDAISFGCVVGGDDLQALTDVTFPKNAELDENIELCLHPMPLTDIQSNKLLKNLLVVHDKYRAMLPIAKKIGLYEKNKGFIYVDVRHRKFHCTEIPGDPSDATKATLKESGDKTKSVKPASTDTAKQNSKGAKSHSDSES